MVLDLITENNRSTMIIFIHGFISGKDTWIRAGGNKSLLDYLKEDASLSENVDFAIFDYFTTVTDYFTKVKNWSSFLFGDQRKMVRNIPIEDIADVLETEFRHKLKGYKKTIIIAHSMGGLVAKNFILKLIKKSTISPVVLFVSLAVPHRGTNLAVLGKIIFGNPQIHDLEPLSLTINQMNDDWLQNSKKLPETMYFQAKYDDIVPKISSKGIDLREIEIDYVADDHFTIVTPESSSSSVVKAISDKVKSLLHIKIRNEINSNLINNIPSNSAARNTLIGIAIDVSGSMQSNLQNNTNKQLNRLQGFNESLKRFTNEAKKTIQENKNKKIDTKIDVFAYAFGLRSGGICDLLSLFKVGKDIITPEEIEQLKQKYISEMQRKYDSYSGFGGVFEQFGLRDLVRSAESVLKQSAENEIKQKIMLEIKVRLEEKLRFIGDTTLSINEVAELINDGGDTLDNAVEFIYGGTPIREVFEEMLMRFIKELANRSNITIPILFLISDGDPTDGDPLPFSDEIKKLGVTIITCFVTSKDIANPKILLGQKDSSWDNATSLMYDMASEVDESSHFASFLLKKGWIIQKEAKLFVQINHSSVLEEFINVVLSPIENSTVGNFPVGE